MIVGQLVGVGYVQLLMVLFLVKGLFYCVVGFSGGCFDVELFDYCMEILEQVEVKVVGVLGKVGLNDFEVMWNYLIDLFGGLCNFWNVIVNGVFFIVKLKDMFVVGDQNDVLFFVGFIVDEVVFFFDFD